MNDKTQISAPMVDISTIATAPRIVEILHPVTEQPVGVLVTLLPQDDPRVRAERNRIQDVMLVLRQKGKQITQAQIERNTINLLKASIESWDWSQSTIAFNGGRPEFTPQNVEAVLTQVTWFRDQIDEELGDEKAFFPK